MIFQIILLIISIIVYVFSPKEYSHLYCIFVTILFLASSFNVIVNKSYSNFFNFHLLFYISLFFVNFVYPTFLYPVDSEYFSIFKYQFNHNLINRSTSLALIGSISYGIGVYFCSEKLRQIKYIENFNYYLPILKLFTFLFFFLFLSFVGNDFFLGIFNSGSSSSNYFLLGLQTFLSLTIIVSLYYKNVHDSSISKFVLSLDYLILSILLIFCVLFLYVGDRGPVIQIVFVIGGAYSLWKSKIEIKNLLLFFVAGFFSMNFIANARVTRTSGFTGSNSIGGFIDRGLSGLLNNSSIDFAMDFIINNRNLYVAIEYADQNGINYGKTMISQVVAIVPGIQRFFVDLFNLDLSNLTSGRVISNLTLGEDATWGVGTNLFGDIYMSFGFIGVILFMFIFGYFNHKFYFKAFFSNSFFYSIVYLISLSYSIYYPRASYFIAFRYILWPVIILVLLKHFWPNPRKSLNSHFKPNVFS